MRISLVGIGIPATKMMRSRCRHHLGDGLVASLFHDLHILSPVVSAARLRAKRRIPDTYKDIQAKLDRSSKVRCRIVAGWGFEV
jgi:hypothetical protein